jgi:predicted O-methyltransferase YrrM
MEHFYQSVPGFFADGDFVFYKEIVQHFVSSTTEPGHFVEVGSYKGRSTSFLAVEIANCGRQIRLDCVDTWKGNEEHQAGQPYEDSDVVNDKLYEVFMANMAPVSSLITPMRMTSLEAAATYADQTLDFVFLDGDHGYAAVKADIAAWWPKLKHGAILSGHDYSLDWPEVMRAANETFGYVRAVANCWYVRKG